MVTAFLIRTFIPNYQETNNGEVRKRYGILGGVVGILVNLLLFTVKLLAGLSINSIAMLADAFNNLSDVASSIITIFGFILAGKPADQEHPFGHGRLEYVAGLIVSFLVILIGYEFFKSSLDRILHPNPVQFNTLAFTIISLAILAKGWLAYFNRHLAKAINSHALSATSFDSISDVISSSCVALSLLATRWTAFPLDGYIGLVVAGIILYAGISLTKDTISPLLGESAPAELVVEIVAKVRSYPGIINTHDLIIHNYGPGQYMVSLHAEVPATMDIMDMHELIDQVERETARDLNLVLTIHMDPVNQDSEEYQKNYQEITQILNQFTEIISFHDLRIIGQGEKGNIIFDIVVKPGLAPAREQALVAQIINCVNEIHPQYGCVIDVDRQY